MTYTKRDIVRRVAEANNDPMIKVEPWVDSVIVALREIMMSADTECRIEIRDFGVFEVKETKAKPKALKRCHETPVSVHWLSPRWGKIVSCIPP